jgi:HAD superfamily hydrolase (TIGR01509 family)
MALKAVALDAMGVIYPVADDLRDLLIPYLRAKGCVVPDEELVRLFRACYRDGKPARELWDGTMCAWDDGALESEFLSQYELRSGVRDFLESMRAAGVPVFGLSNDVAEWAVARRKTFGIDAHFVHWVISGEVRTYKPQPEIFEIFLQRLPGAPGECLFIDDSATNVESARALGLQAVRFSPLEPSSEQSVADFADLERLVRSLM